MGAAIKVRSRSLPAKILNRIKDRYIYSQCRKVAKQQCIAPVVEERLGQRTCPRN
jgi:hypothetical protein